MFKRTSGTRNDAANITLFVDKHPLGIPFYRPGDYITGVVLLENVAPATVESATICLEGFQDVCFIDHGKRDIETGPAIEKASLQFLNVTTDLSPPQDTKPNPSGAYELTFRIEVPLEISRSDARPELDSDLKTFYPSDPEQRYVLPPSAYDGATSHVRYRLMATGPEDPSRSFFRRGALTAEARIQVIPEFSFRCTTEALEEETSSAREALKLEVIEPRSSKRQTSKLLGRMLSTIQPSQRYIMSLDAMLTSPSKIQLNNPQPFKLILKLLRSKTEPEQPYFDLALTRLRLELCKYTQQRSRQRSRREQHCYNLLKHRSVPFQHCLEFETQTNGLEVCVLDLGVLLGLQVPRRHEDGSHWPSIFQDGVPDCTPTFRSVMYNQTYALNCSFDVVQVDRPERIVNERRRQHSLDVQVIGPPPTIANEK